MTERTIWEAALLAGQEERVGRVAVIVICGRHEPSQVIGSVRQHPELGFVLRTGGSRGNGQTLTAFIGSEPDGKYHYLCPVCGDLVPDPALLAEKVRNYRTSGVQQKLLLA